MRRLNSLGFTTHEEVGKWYDQKFTEMGGSWYVPTEELELFLDKLGVGAPPWKLLELGCGDGKLLIRASLRGGTVDGTDISIVARNMARKNLNDAQLYNVALLDCPMENLQVPANEYDFVISYGSIEHALDPQKATNEMARVLKPGGRWLNYAPNEEWIHEDQPLETTMTADEWLVLYSNAGLQIEVVAKMGDNTLYIGTK